MKTGAYFTYIRKGEYVKASDHFKRAFTLAEEIGYLFCMGNCMKGLGNICVREDDREKALNYYDQALKLYERSGSVAEANNFKKITNTLNSSSVILV